jgi:hypothetical protein
VEPLEDASVVRFRSGTRYTYVAVRRGGVCHTSSRGSPREDESIHEFAWNPINKVETWPDLVARGNTFALAVDWAPAPALLKRDLAVVRFMLDDDAEWNAAVHAGSGSWYSTVDDGAYSGGDGGGLRIYDHPEIRRWGDIVEYSSRIDVANQWEPLTGIGLPALR